MKPSYIYLKKLLISGIVTICMAFMLQLTSCKKETDNNTYTIAGHLYVDCNLEPVKNYKIQLMVNHPNGSNMSDYDMTVETTTDSSGYYKFEFKNKGDYPLVILYSAGAGYNIIMSGIPARVSLSELPLHINSSTNVELGLNVINPYSSNDTLYITDYRTNDYMAIPGPFTSGKVYTAIDYYLFVENYTGEKRAVSWYINHFAGVINEKWFTIDKFCKDTVFVNVDIK